MNAATTETIILAGGCFWCVEAVYAPLSGVTEVVSGYTGGTEQTATYERVCQGGTGHIEAVRVRFDSAAVSLDAILHVYWQNIDPLDAGGQFADRGESYTTAIFVADEQQRRIAEASKKELEDRLGEPVATRILPQQPFYPAEDYHQQYYRKKPVHYEAYKHGSGRQHRLAQLSQRLS